MVTWLEPLFQQVAQFLGKVALVGEGEVLAGDLAAYLLGRESVGVGRIANLNR